MNVSGNVSAGGLHVTALLLTWNSAEKLEPSLKSLIDQDYSRFDILIGDDASSDETIEIVQRCIGNASNVRLIRRPENIGSFRNLFETAKAAKGDFVFWACPGDNWSPNFVSECVRAVGRVPDAVAALPRTDYFAESSHQYLRTERFDQFPAPEKIPHWKLATMIPVKSRPGDQKRRRFGLFIHGLLDKNTLCRALDSLSYSSGVANERVVMCQLALAGRFVTIPDSLFYKESSDRSFIERAPHDPNAQRRADRSLAVAKVAWQLALSLALSKAFPARRKVFIPLIVGYFIGWHVLHSVQIATIACLSSILPGRSYNALRALWHSIAACLSRVRAS